MKPGDLVYVRGNDMWLNLRRDPFLQSEFFNPAISARVKSGAIGMIIAVSLPVIGESTNELFVMFPGPKLGWVWELSIADAIQQ